VSALAEALLAAQRQAIGAAAKAYVAGDGDDYGAELFTTTLDAMGCTDKVEQAQLLSALDTLRKHGAAPVANGKPDTAAEPATEAQLRYIADLTNERGVIAPDGPLTKEQASKVIEQLKAGSYVADEWTVPF
jgi:hypothetical protein